MSVLQYPEAFNAAELQIWNNAAFDNGESEDSTAIKASWSNLQYVNPSDSLQSDCSKENQSPVLVKSPVFINSSIPIKPLQANGVIGNSKMSINLVSKQGVVDKLIVSKNGSEEGEEKVRDERKIDVEIEEIEREINRLSSRLEALRIEKAERNTKTIEKRGRIVPAKFMEQQKQSSKNFDGVKKIEENLLSSAKTKINRRGVSLGPAEIFTAVKSRRQSMMMKPEITPVQSIQNRRKSCFFKLQDIDEGKVTKGRGNSLSLSPKSRKTVSKIQAPKQAVTTIGSKRSVKKDDGVISLIQPKKLFKDGEKSLPAKKPMKPGRIVASRYNQITASEVRKRSLPENCKEESNKRRNSRENGIDSCRSLKSESSNRVKKKWEIIPSDVVVYKGDMEEEEESQPSVLKIGDVLPKIRTIRCVNESPRDSGAAKRVAELVGRKSYFCGAEVEAEGGSVCQALRFDFEEEEAEEE